jgi:hypothetical protein
MEPLSAVRVCHVVVFKQYIEFNQLNSKPITRSKKQQTYSQTEKLVEQVQIR